MAERKEQGYCHICGKYEYLTYEHIPPEKAMNNKKATMFVGEEAIKRAKGEKAKYTLLQRGIGKYTLCEDCNNKTGAWYAASYVEAVRDVFFWMETHEQLVHGDVVRFTFHKFRPLSFIKQVIAMFCSQIPIGYVKELGFDKLLLDKQNNIIDKSLFDLRMYLTTRDARMMIGPAAVLCRNNDGFSQQWITELEFYPFGFILNTTPEHSVNYGTSIMEMLNKDYLYEGEFEIELPYLERPGNAMPLPLIFKPLKNE